MHQARRLDGHEIEEFANPLGAAFPPHRFTQFLLFRLNRQTWNYAGQIDDYPTTLLRVIQDANAQLWWRDLVGEARKTVPADPGLLAFEERLSIAPKTVVVDGGELEPVEGRQLELKIKDAQPTFDIGTWHRRLGEIEGCVCRIEFRAYHGHPPGALPGGETRVGRGERAWPDATSAGT